MKKIFTNICFLFLFAFCIQQVNTQFVKSFIEYKLESRNVYPTNNRVGFTGDISSISYFISGIIESYIDSYLIENQVDTIYNI